MTTDTIEVPIKLPSLSNARWHHHKRAGIVKRQRNVVSVALRALQLGPLRGVPLREVPLTIELVRVSPRRLDDDNLRGALKATRDAVTTWLGHSDDAHPHLRWMYGQAKDGRKRYQAARITIVVGHHNCGACGSELLEAS